VYPTLAARERQGAMEMKDVQHNQTVGLASDAEFRGIIWGESAPPDLILGPVMLVYTKAPGATGKHGCTLIPLAQLVKVAR